MKMLLKRIMGRLNMIKNNRVTIVMGAGVPLNFQLPAGMTSPSTENITKEVRKDYSSIFQTGPVTIVEDMYQHLMATLPSSADPFMQNPQPYVHFEMLFHVMEMYLSYAKVWSGNTHNPGMYPIFAPFVNQARIYNKDVLQSIMGEFILRIMDIVNTYDDYFRKKPASEVWYREFFQQAPWKWDVYNFNYDTTVEQCLIDYEDGFDDIAGQNYKRFLPQKLMLNPRQLSTVNHLHGCIHFFYDKTTNHDVYNYVHGDLFRYPNYHTVRSLYIGRAQSQPTNQTNEELYTGPIITGLRKTDKLICVPYDYYHTNLGKSLMQNRRLIIVGYSFGDLYMNQQLKRMGLIHGCKRRIVLVDFWNQTEVNRYGVEKYMMYKIPTHMQEFLMMMCEESYVGNLPKVLDYQDTQTPMFSSNGCLMLFTCGMRDAVSKYYGDIIKFLLR